MTSDVADEIDAGRVRNSRSLGILSPVAGESETLERSKPSIPLIVDLFEGVPYLLALSNAPLVGAEAVVPDNAVGVLIGGEGTDEKVDDA